MISLLRHINATRDEEPLRQIISLLISKIGASAVRCDLDEFGAFTADIEALRNRLVPDLASDSVLVLAETAAQALTAYNGRIASLLDSQRNEVQHIMSMLQDTLIDVAGENTRSGKRLQEITLELEKSGPITDLRVLKGRLTECLTGLREEMLQQKAQVAMTMEKLQVRIERGGNSVVAGRANPVDPVTGLPEHDDGIAAMQVAIDRGKRHYAVVMMVNRVEMVNARFGQKVGDHMLTGFKEHVAKQLSGADQLFRWNGPVLVAVIERSEPVASVRLLVRRMLDARIDVNYAGSGRSVLIPVSAVWSVILLATTVDADKQIQAFVAAQSSQN